MYNRYIRRDDGTYPKVAEPDPPRQETAGPGQKPPPPPPDDSNESGPRSGGPPPSFGGAEGLAGYLRQILLRQYMHNTEIAVTMRLSTILKTIKQPL